QPSIEALLGGRAVGIGGDLVAVARQGVAQVFADRRLVFDDGDTSRHDAARLTHGRWPLGDRRHGALPCLAVATFDHSGARARPGRAPPRGSNAALGNTTRETHGEPGWRSATRGNRRQAWRAGWSAPGRPRAGSGIRAPGSNG